MAPSSLDSMFEWHSSSVDWCEANYAVTPYVAEFYNTISNLVFLIGPPLAVWYNLNVYKVYGYHQFYAFILLFVIGTGSIYFHATLSFAGQILDELCILWIITYGSAMYIPKERYPTFISTSTQWCGLLGFITIISTISPYLIGRDFSIIVAPALMCTSVPISVVIHQESQIYSEKLGSVNMKIIRTSTFLFFLAVMIWLVDRLVCPNELIHIELHAVWHILAYLSGHLALTYLAQYQILRDYNVVHKVGIFPVPHIIVSDEDAKKKLVLKRKDRKDVR